LLCASFYYLADTGEFFRTLGLCSYNSVYLILACVENFCSDISCLQFKFMHRLTRHVSAIRTTNRRRDICEKFTSFCQVQKRDAHKRKLVPFFCVTVYIRLLGSPQTAWVHQLGVNGNGQRRILTPPPHPILYCYKNQKELRRECAVRKNFFAELITNVWNSP